MAAHVLKEDFHLYPREELKKKGSRGRRKLAPRGCRETALQLGNKIKMLEKGWAWKQATHDMMQEEKRPNIRQGPQFRRNCCNCRDNCKTLLELGTHVSF